MRAAGHITLTLTVMLGLAPLCGAAQGGPGMRTSGRVAKPGIGTPGELFPQQVEPLNGCVEWLREEVDPIRRARRQIRREMYRRADEQAMQAAAGAVRSSKPQDPAVEWADWRFSVGNNGNWSPYPDRELDARNIRFPLRMKTDNRPEAEKALDRMRKEHRP